ncbi:MAG: hypothetical protein LC121_21985 [Anaerolineae bacterium]|nr:hypothetical protein [Anaerolineae bacterium]
MIGWIANSLTWLQAFKGPCLILAGIAFLAGAGAATWATRAIMQGNVARAEQRLSDFRAELATQSASIERQAAERQQAAADALRERDQSITSAVDAIPAEVARLVAPQFARLRESVNETRFDCLRYPLPDDFLRELRRPGGSAADPDR